jgi:hypothetical protein
MPGFQAASSISSSAISFCVLLLFFSSCGGVGMMKTEYDPATAVTFLLAGMGLGAVMALIFAPRRRWHALMPEGDRPEPPRQSRAAGAV